LNPYDLQRFLYAQSGVFDSVLRELNAGRKNSHWMWFIFPQVSGLGRSSTAKHYAIASIEEARAYLAHPELSGRLRECCELLLRHRNRRAEDVLGGVDALKLRSSMTLFAGISDEPVFSAVLDAFFDGHPDPVTESTLDRWRAGGDTGG
jgi:uncharacterized protein (DUF1810 family)